MERRWHAARQAAPQEEARTPRDAATPGRHGSGGERGRGGRGGVTWQHAPSPRPSTATATPATPAAAGGRRVSADRRTLSGFPRPGHSPLRHLSPTGAGDADERPEVQPATADTPAVAAVTTTPGLWDNVVTDLELKWASAKVEISGLLRWS